MQVSLSGLSKAMAKVRSFADGNNNVPGVMFDIHEQYMDVCYSDGKKAVIEQVNVHDNDQSVMGRIVLPFSRMMSIIDILQPTGHVATSDLDMKFLPNSIMEISAVKSMTVYESAGQSEESTEAPAEDGEVGADWDSPEYAQQAIEGAAPQTAIQSEQADEEEVIQESIIVSKFDQRINYERPEDNLRYGILSRMNYEDIFVGSDGESTSDFTVWDISQFREVLSRTSIEKGKTVYVSKNEQCAFVCNLAYASNIPVSEVGDNGFVVSTSLAKSIIDILGKVDTDGSKILVKNKDSRYVCIINDKGTFGLWFEMAPASRTDAATIHRYKERKYGSFRVAFSREAFQNVLNSAISVDKTEKTVLEFVMEGNGPALHIVSNNSGASISNDFKIMATSKFTHLEVMLAEKLPMSIKVLSDMVNNCVSDYIEFALDTDEAGGRYIRIGDIDMESDGGYNPDVDGGLLATHYTIAAKTA